MSYFKQFLYSKFTTSRQELAQKGSEDDRVATKHKQQMTFPVLLLRIQAFCFVPPGYSTIGSKHFEGIWLLYISIPGVRATGIQKYMLMF